MPEQERIALQNIKRLKIPTDQLVKTCRYRQGTQACRYIMHIQAVNEICCVKHFPPGRSQIEAEESEMRAKGDNCPGLGND